MSTYEFKSMRRPYDIQRGTIRTGYSETARYSEAVANDYMGSSEFEWGALPASLRRMQANRESLSCISIPQVVDVRGAALTAYGNFLRIDPQEYREAILSVVRREASTRERTGFEDQNEPAERRRLSVTNVWWDINNDVIMSFDAGFMEGLPRILSNSWAYMDASAKQPA